MTAPEVGDRWLNEIRSWAIAHGPFAVESDDDIRELCALYEEAHAAGYAEAREAAAAKVQAELDKLGGRWSLDSCYLHHAIDSVRSLSPSAGSEKWAARDGTPGGPQ